MHNIELFIAFKAIGSQLRIIHIILNPELFIASRSLGSWDSKSFISSITLNLRSGVVHVIHNLKLMMQINSYHP